MRPISANNSSTRSGERPSEGSSRMSSLGSAIRPRPMASICCSPPGQRTGALRLPLGKPREYRKHALAISRAARRGAPIAAEIEILAHRRDWGRCGGPPGTWIKPARDDRRRLFALDLSARRNRIEPALRAHDAGDGAIERRLADTVGAEHGDDLAGIDAQGRRRAALRSRRSRRADPAPRAADQWPCAPPSFAAAPWPR